MTTKTIKTVMFAIISSVILTSTTSVVGNVFAENINECDEKITDAITAKMAEFDQTQIQTKTSADNDFQQKYASMEPRDVGIAFIGTTDKENCTADVTSINHQFLLERGPEMKRLSVQLDPKDLSVTKITETVERSIQATSQGTNYGTYAGWTVRDDAGESSSTINEVKAYWTLPTISDPSGLNCGTSGTSRCNFTVWTGITDKPHGTDFIAQAGTNSQCVGTDCGTNVYYDGILQIWDNGNNDVNIICDVDQSIAFDNNDDVYAKVKYYSITDQYTLYVEEEGTGNYCSTAHTETVELPRYGQFIAERPQSGSTPTNLGEVSDFYIEGYFYDNGSLKGLDDIDGGNYDYWEQKIGTWILNVWVDPGTPLSTDKFLVHYIKSN